MRMVHAIENMINPFPGMNPYLEQPEFWADFHAQLIAASARVLVPQLLPKYRVVTDKWTYKISDTTLIGVGRPDIAIQKRRNESRSTTSIVQSSVSVQPVPVQIPQLEEVQQSYLEVRDAATKEVITAIEVLSPANKRSDGRRKYEAKRQDILESLTHLIEIDLLREGEPLPMEADRLESHYRILISRSNTRPIADLYAFNLSDRIPNIPIPLRPEDPEPVLDLQQILTDLYEQLGYAYFIDYTQTPPLPWSMSEVEPWIRD
jgi:Protein of unknown function (DUF4058)